MWLTNRHFFQSFVPWFYDHRTFFDCIQRNNIGTIDVDIQVVLRSYVGRIVVMVMTFMATAIVMLMIHIVQIHVVQQLEVATFVPLQHNKYI
jgi:hypothetical protein